MQWYYEHQGQALGPVTEEQMEALRLTGIVTPTMRVWREDWAEWRVASEVWLVAAGAAPAFAADPAMAGSCEECGAKDPGMVSIGGQPVCPACEPFAREKLVQGVPLGIGPWREGKKAVIRRDAPLPQRCIKCAAPSTAEVRKRLSWHHPAIYLAIPFAGLLYVILAMCLRKTFTVRIPLCEGCKKRRWRNIAILGVGLLASFGSIIWGCARVGVSTNNDPAGMFILGGCLGLLFFLGFSIFIQVVVAKKIDERYAWVSKVGPPWLKLLPKWPYG